MKPKSTLEKVMEAHYEQKQRDGKFNYEDVKAHAAAEDALTRKEEMRYKKRVAFARMSIEMNKLNKELDVTPQSKQITGSKKC